MFGTPTGVLIAATATTLKHGSFFFNTLKSFSLKFQRKQSFK